MRLTVLGKSPAWQDAGGACSGYLLEDSGTALLVDCGNGVFAKLREHIDYVDLDAVVISHLHADHFLDLVPYSYALTYAPPAAGAGGPLAGHRPPGAARAARASRRARGLPASGGGVGNDDLIENAFHLREYDPSEEISIGSLSVRFQRVPHFTETFAMSLSSTNGGGRLVYGADYSPTDALQGIRARGDLMLVEATLPRPERTGMRGHLTPEEAGAHARGAAAKRLVLVHISTSSTRTGPATRRSAPSGTTWKWRTTALSTRSRSQSPGGSDPRPDARV